MKPFGTERNWLFSGVGANYDLVVRETSEPNPKPETGSCRNWRSRELAELELASKMGKFGRKSQYHQQKEIVEIDTIGAVLAIFNF